MNHLIDKSMQVIRNLPVKVVADQQRTKNHTVAKDSYANRCINHIEKIRKYAPEGNFSDPKAPSYNPPRTRREKYAVKMLDEAYKIYLFLSNFDPRVGERQHWNSNIKEYSLDAIIGSHDPSEEGDEWEDSLLEDGVVETNSPEAYSGGLGYRHVNWDAEYLMAQPKGKHINPYWRPDLPRNQPGTKEHREMLSLEESGYWACQPREPNKWYEKMGWTLVESSSR